MNLETLFPVFIVAILSVIGNVIFFKYQFKKNKKWKILDQQLTELLLPLFYNLKNDEFDRIKLSQEEECPDTYEYYYQGFVADRPKRLLKIIVPIVKNKLYLADDDFHKSCIEFLSWAYTSNYEDRKIDFECGTKSKEKDKAFYEFKDLVYKKYNETRNKYLKK